MTQRNDKVTATVQVGGMINYTPCSIEVGEVTTLPAGSDATVTNSGNEYEAVFDFGIPQGAKGDTGETGATGKSAYESAVEQGYEGTEEEFATSLTTVDTKAAQAAASATAAAGSATSASNSATSASNSATTATTKASEASASATAAAASATSAGSNATAAQNYVTQASTFASNASNSATNAASYASNAASSATNASAMASSASTSASSASASADTASAVLTDPDFVAVAGAVEDITTVATNISDVNATGQAIEDVSAVADNLADITLVANDLENIDEVATKVAEWQKPADWVDIRSGAQDNSIYALVGHKADYSKYNLFPIKTNVNNSGTYDIYIDGVKKYGGVASGTETLINWQTLNLTSGFDVTHPEALKTHIIRITPTVSTNQLTQPKFVSSSISSQTEGIGVLWLHFFLDYALIINSMCRTSGVAAKILEAVTSENGVIKSAWGDEAFYNASSLETFPLLEVTSGNASQSEMFSYTNIKRLRIKLDAPLGSTRSSYNTHMPQCKEIINESKYPLHSTTFSDCPKLKRILGPISRTYPNTINNFFGGNISMENMFLDFSEGVNLKRMVIGGFSSIPLPWFKGLTVSNQAPFNSATAPQLNVSYTGLDRAALVNLFNSMPTVSASQVCNITGATGAADLTAEDLAIATNKGWTVTR